MTTTKTTNPTQEQGAEKVDPSEKYKKLRTKLFFSEEFNGVQIPGSATKTTLESLFYAARTLASGAQAREYKAKHNGKNTKPFDYTAFNKYFGEIYGTPSEPLATIEEFVEIGKRLSPRVFYQKTLREQIYEMVVINQEELQRGNLQKSLKTLTERGASTQQSGGFKDSLDDLEDLEDVGDAKVNDFDDLIDDEDEPKATSKALPDNDDILEDDL